MSNTNAEIHATRGGTPTPAFHIVIEDMIGQLEFFREQLEDLQDLYAKLESDYIREIETSLNYAKIISRNFKNKNICRKTK